MRSILKFTALAATLSLAIACAKGPAEAALKAADAAVAAAKPEAEKYAADTFKKVEDAAKGAHEKFNAGDYKGALMAAKEIPAQVSEVTKAAAAKKDEMMKSWAGMESEMPKMVESMTAKVTELAAMKKMPAGMDAAKLEGAKADLATISTEWAAAADAAKTGMIADAISKGDAVKAKADALMTTLGLSAAPATDAAAAPAADAKPAA